MQLERKPQPRRHPPVPHVRAYSATDMAQRVGLADQLGPDRVLATIDATNGWPLRPQVGERPV
jgi:hypothetical protein